VSEFAGVWETEEVFVAAPRRLGLLTSLAVTANLLGRHDEALTYHEQALALAVGPEAERRPDVEAGRLLTLVAVGRGDEALPGLIAFRVDPRRHPAALASVACAWVILLANRPSLPSDATLTRSVVPVVQSWTKASTTPFVSSVTRFVAALVNATTWPSSEIPEGALSPSPPRMPSAAMLISLTVSAQ